MELLREAQELVEHVGESPDDEFTVVSTRGAMAIAAGDAASALAIARAAEPSGVTLRGRSRIQNLITMALAELGEFDGARVSAELALRLDQQRGSPFAIAIDHGILAEIALRTGDRASAARHQLDSLSIALQHGDETNFAYAAIVAARALEGSDWLELTYLHGHADVLLERLGQILYVTDRQLSDELLAKARNRLGDEAYDRAYGDGAAAQITDVVERTRAALRRVAGA